MNELIYMVGLPGSGKSTMARKIAKERNYIVHSSDGIRAELGDINDQSRNKEVFQILHKRVKADLAAGKSVIYDTCGIKRKDRVAFLQEIKKIPCKKTCLLMATPYEECLAQNFARDRQVPVDVMMRFYKNFHMPCTQEGFDEVIVHYNKEEWKTWYGSVVEYIERVRAINQDNPHHELSIGDHMLEAGRYLMRTHGLPLCDDLVLATFSHDIGKKKTKAFVNGKGESTEIAHYYSHHNVGSYDCLFYQYLAGADKEYIALLIEMHMKPFLEWSQSDRTKRRDINIFGEDIIRDVELLHEADLAAH